MVDDLKSTTRKEKVKKVAYFKISFSGDPEELKYLNWLKERRELSAWVTKAIKFYYDWEKYYKGFCSRLVQYDFSLFKHLVRQIGRTIKKDSCTKTQQ